MLMKLILNVLGFFTALILLILFLYYGSHLLFKVIIPFLGFREPTFLEFWIGSLVAGFFIGIMIKEYTRNKYGH